jgi:ubiquinone/menaquinone biosynthesis C-methylase UbiE
MKGRESGMPAKEVWEGFFSPAEVLGVMQLDSRVADVVEFGCGYGTFTLPAAKIVRGVIHAIDIDPAMVALTRSEAEQHGLSNIRTVLRDFMAEGTGLGDASVDYAMLFNILHIEQPDRILQEAWRVLRDNGKLGIIHWNYDSSTPRGPSLTIRPKPEQCIAWASAAGFTQARIYDLKPYHYGIIMEKGNKEEDYKRLVQGAFDEASHGYDTPVMRFFDNSAEYLVKQLPLKGNEHILDAATGTGKLALLAARHLPRGHVTAIDLSEGMLSQAKNKAQTVGISNIAFLCMDVDKANFPENHFDGLCCSFGVHFWSGMQASLGRLARMIKPGGFVAITSFAKGSFEPQSTLSLNQFKKYGVKLPDHYALERLDSPEKVEALLQSIGLRNIQIAQNPMGYYLTDALQWWEMILFSGYRAFLNQLSPEQADLYRRENLEEIEKLADDRGIYLNVDVIFAVARKALAGGL